MQQLGVKVQLTGMLSNNAFSVR